MQHPSHFQRIGVKSSMGINFANTFVMGATVLVLAQAPGAAPAQPDPITDQESYAIYAALVPVEWATVSKDVLLLQDETERASPCTTSASSRDSDWRTIENDFKRENAGVRSLRALLTVDIPYRLVPRAEILADDARLALKYPGRWQRRPESMEYAAVSAVGFNAAKTKAMVYVRTRSHGAVHLLELLDGRWVDARLGGCVWWA